MIQGRVQTLREKSYTQRNCKLFSSVQGASQASEYTALSANGLGKACTYQKHHSFKEEAATLLHEVFAYNDGQCCNACVATTGCVAANRVSGSNDEEGGFGPQSWEGFGMHITDVVDAKTTGGITVAELESHYQTRLGDHSEFDQFMDYSVTFFTADLQSYHDKFTKDKVPFHLSQWKSSDSTWYSLIFLVPSSHYVIELVSQKVTGVTTSSLPVLEQRMSDAHCKKFSAASQYPDIMFVSSINRAASDMDGINDIYVGSFGATITHKIDKDGLSRHCYYLGASTDSGDIDVCFTKRSGDAKKDAIFSVVDFEEMLWAEHAGTLADNPDSKTDKYTDNHYAMPFVSLTKTQEYFYTNNPYPITKNTRFAYACKQNYIIDVTGWSIQPIGQASWPNCGSSPGPNSSIILV